VQLHSKLVLALYLLPSLTRPSILIMDNAPIHRKTAIRLLVEDFSALKRAIMYSHSATSLDEIIRAYCAT
jgi:transposase